MKKKIIVSYDFNSRPYRLHISSLDPEGVKKKYLTSQHYHIGRRLLSRYWCFDDSGRKTFTYLFRI